MPGCTLHAMQSTITIGLFDDHIGFSKSLEAYLTAQDGLQVLWTASDKEELFLKLGSHLPDVTVVDIVTENTKGLEVFHKLSQDGYSTHVVAHTSLTNPVIVQNLFNYNVKAYVSKAQDIDKLIKALRIVADGGVYVPQGYEFVLKNGDAQKKELSKREVEILELMAQGKKSDWIAAELFISKNTVDNHRKNMLQKLEVSNVAELIYEATQQGYLP